MGTIGRTTPTFVADTPAKASEVNAEFDNLITWANGNVDNANVSDTADIAESKVDDISLNAPAARDDLDPQTSGNPALDGALESEIKRLRYKVKQNGVGTNAVFLDSAGVETDCGWQEQTIVSSNLLVNPSFENHTAGADEAPDGWTLVGTPTLTTGLTATTEGTGNEVRILAATGANEGISQTISNIKADAYYLVGCRAKQAVGTARIFTADALDAGHYQDLDISTTSGTYVTLSGVVQAKSGADAITVSIVGVLQNDNIDADHAFMYELGTDRLGSDHGSALVMPEPEQTTDPAQGEVINDSTETYLSTTISTLADRPSYIEVTGYINLYYTTGGTSSDVEITLEQDIDAAGESTVAGRFPCPGSGEGPLSIPIHYIDWSPGLDESHEFYIKIFNDGSGQSVWVNSFNTGGALWTSALTAVVRPKV